MAAQTTATITAPTTNPRIDRIVIDDTTGTASVIPGTEAASPSPPSLTAGKLPIAQLALAVGQSAIVNADITDERAWPLQLGQEFAAGDRLVFQQSTAPTGYTKETNGSFNDVALRIVTGTVGSGGATGFATVFGSGLTTGLHTLTTTQIPSHNHDLAASVTSAGFAAASEDGGSTSSTRPTSTAGGGSPHDHTLSLDLAYRDIIIAQKD